MRVLLDECLPVVLRAEFQGHDVRTVRYMGWTGVQNGELLRLMIENGFEVFMTTDQNLRFQQNIQKAGVAVIELQAKSNRIESLMPHVQQIRSVLNRIKPGELISIDA